MRKPILPVVFLAAFGAAGAAFAEDATGKIMAIDHATMTVTLEDGSVYKFDSKDEYKGALSGLRAGDKVLIVWSDANGTRAGEAISPAGR